jgi:hypothetical protein
MKGLAKQIFSRRTLSDLIVFWFAVWILWWFLRWAGHGSANFSNPNSSAGRALYAGEMRTLVRSLGQSFGLAVAGLAVWRLYHRRTGVGRRDSSVNSSR